MEAIILVLVIVTSNTNKYKQILPFLGDMEIKLEKPKYKIHEIQSKKWDEVLCDKVLKAYEQFQTPCMVDDSGLLLDNYPEFPGIQTKFVLATLGLDGIRKLLSDDYNKGCSLCCGVAYVDSSMQPIVCYGKVHGTMKFDRVDYMEGCPGILSSVFIPDEGEYPTMLHRVRAVKKLFGIMEAQNGI